jgi:hypothetical protein
MAATSVRDAEISTETGERALDLLATSDLELAWLLTGQETREDHQALDPIAWQLLEGAQNVRRWLWTVALVALVALALLVVGFFAPSP